jgi:hypothetical protein
MLQSRKWKAILIDAIFSVLVLAVSFWLADPKWQDFTLKLIAIIQPVVIAYVLGVAYEDGQAKRAVTYTDAPPSPYVTTTTGTTKQ